MCVCNGHVRVWNDRRTDKLWTWSRVASGYFPNDCVDIYLSAVIVVRVLFAVKYVLHSCPHSHMPSPSSSPIVLACLKSEVFKLKRCWPKSNHHTLQVPPSWLYVAWKDPWNNCPWYRFGEGDNDPFNLLRRPFMCAGNETCVSSTWGCTEYFGQAWPLTRKW